MQTLKRVVENGVCVFCSKEKEVVETVMDGQEAVLLCWADVRKMAHMKMRMSGQPKQEVKVAMPANGPVAAPK